MSISLLCCLNDQGGAVMNVTHDKTNTLRAQDHGHPPLIIIRKKHEDSNRTGPVQPGHDGTEDHDSMCISGRPRTHTVCAGFCTEHSAKSRSIGYERESGVQRSGPVQSRQYYMTDKAGHMCRWKLLDKAMTLQATDYKDPPAILAPGR